MFLTYRMPLKFLICLILIVFSITTVYSTTQTILVDVNESVLEVGTYNSQSGWLKNRNFIGQIIVTNINPTETVSDIYVYFDNASNINGVSFLSGLQGEVLNFGGDEFELHVPQLQPGNITIFNYSIDSSIKTPINFTTTYSVGKVLSGEEFNVEDVLENIFDNASYQTDTCIYDIVVNQSLMKAGNFTFDSAKFLPATIAGTDSANVVFSGGDKIQTWNVDSGGCLNKGSNLDINYDIKAPLNTDATLEFNLSNSTISYKLNSTVSHLRLKKIEGIGDGNLTLRKEIIKPSHPTLHGTNVTWQVNGSFETESSLSYILRESSFWVSRKNVDGMYTNISKIDVDGISGDDLNYSFYPNFEVNSSSSWDSSNWLFNYSDEPSPITWFAVNFTLKDDGVQLVNKSIFRSDNSVYYKEIVVISGYLLQIEKNVTSLGSDKYNVLITVFNRGSQITPSGSIVTVYDFVPENYSIDGSLSYLSSSWYSTTRANNSVSGGMTGNLQQWAIVPSNKYNSSLLNGVVKNESTSWSVSYNITGHGDYNNLDVFITGLDPQKVDGAGAVSSIIVLDNFFELDVFESIFAVISGVLVFVIFLL